MTDWLSVWLTDCLIDWVSDWLTNWVADWLTEWLVHWLTDWLSDWLTDSIERSHFRKLPSLQLVKKLTRILLNSEKHHRIHNRPPLVPVLSQKTATPSHILFLCVQIVLYSHFRLVLPSDLFPSGVPTKTLHNVGQISLPSNSLCFDLPNNILWRGDAYYEALHYAVFSSFPLYHSTQTQSPLPEG